MAPAVDTDSIETPRSGGSASVRRLIVAGMHRSGTSLLASYLGKAGLYLGSQLLPADIGNPRGYFEDEAFLQFHNEILRRNGLGYFFRDLNVKIETTEEDVQRALALTSRFDAQKQWGWKDPRTTLFLDFWDRVFREDVYYLLVFRKPIAVVNSLVRRATDPQIVKRPSIALASWIFYNQSLCDHFIRCPHRCLLVELTDVIEKSDDLISQLVNRHQFELDPGTLFTSVYCSAELASQDLMTWRTRRSICMHPIMAKRADLLYRKLKRMASLQSL